MVAVRSRRGVRSLARSQCQLLAHLARASGWRFWPWQTSRPCLKPAAPASVLVNVAAGICRASGKDCPAQSGLKSSRPIASAALRSGPSGTGGRELMLWTALHPCGSLSSCKAGEERHVQGYHSRSGYRQVRFSGSRLFPTACRRQRVGGILPTPRLERSGCEHSLRPVEALQRRAAGASGRTKIWVN
jgi:hypothetical protein